jgi:hypothetical protein
MGYLESAVVVYLRKIYYPSGFDFPLAPMETQLALTEVFREAATIIMLVGIAVLAGKNKMQRFAYFLFCFAVWDIFYYVFLKVILDWPDSLLSPDILFLIPVPWVGPVIAPCMIAFFMIILGMQVLYFQDKGNIVKFNARESILLLSGCMLVLISFMWDYIQYTSAITNSHGRWSLSSKESMFKEIENYVPLDFNWGLFLLGLALIILGLLDLQNRLKSRLKNHNDLQ